MKSANVIAAMQAIATWKERNPDQKVPTAEEMTTMLDNFANPPPPPPTPPAPAPVVVASPAPAPVVAAPAPAPVAASRPLSSTVSYTGGTFRCPSSPLSDSEDEANASAPAKSPTPEKILTLPPLSFEGRADLHMPFQYRDVLFVDLPKQWQDHPLSWKIKERDAHYEMRRQIGLQIDRQRLAEKKRAAEAEKAKAAEAEKAKAEEEHNRVYTFRAPSPNGPWSSDDETTDEEVEPAQVKKVVPAPTVEESPFDMDENVTKPRVERGPPCPPRLLAQRGALKTPKTRRVFRPTPIYRPDPTPVPPTPLKPRVSRRKESDDSQARILQSVKDFVPVGAPKESIIRPGALTTPLDRQSFMGTSKVQAPKFPAPKVAETPKVAKPWQAKVEEPPKVPEVPKLTEEQIKAKNQRESELNRTRMQTARIRRITKRSLALPPDMSPIVEEQINIQAVVEAIPMKEIDQMNMLYRYLGKPLPESFINNTSAASSSKITFGSTSASSTSPQVEVIPRAPRESRTTDHRNVATPAIKVLFDRKLHAQQASGARPADADTFGHTGLTPQRPQPQKFEIGADIESLLDAPGFEADPIFTSLADSHRSTFAAGFNKWVNNDPAFTISDNVQDAVDAIPEEDFDMMDIDTGTPARVFT